MAMEQDKVLDKVRKLLAKAEDPGVTEAEAEAYNNLAAKLISQYGVDRALLAESGEVVDEIARVSISIDNPYSHDKKDLLAHIASALRCKTVHYGSGRSITRVVVFGYQSDLERVELLYTSLLLQATNQLVKARPQDDDDRWGPRESTAAYRRSWMAGFRAAVYRRLRASESDATVQADERHEPTSGTSTALVLRSRETRVDDAFTAAFPKLRMAKRRTTTGSGFGDGHSAGQRADLGGRRLDGQRREITEG